MYRSSSWIGVVFGLRNTSSATVGACRNRGSELPDKVDFVAADMPDANRLTIHIIAAVAEAVARTVSENTKTALAAAKARGVKLGNPNGARALRGTQVGNAD